MVEGNSKQTERARNQVIGCMVGGAVGDALGYRVEFLSWPQIQIEYGPRGITRYRGGKGYISDDTQMSLFTAGGILLGMTRGCMRGIMGRIDTYCWNSYQDWLMTQEHPSLTDDDEYYTWLVNVPELFSRRAPGNTCLSALRAEAAGYGKAQNNSCGCGGVMRTAPLALLNHIHQYEKGDVLYCDMCAAEAARITHKHPLGFIPSAVLNHILTEILKEGDLCPERLPDYVERALAALPDIESAEDDCKTYGELWPEHVKKQRDIIHKALDLAASSTPDPAAIESIGGGWTGHEALAIAIYSAVKHCNSFEDAIISCVNHSGDSDSTGAVCGNIMGCLHGRSSIPEYYTENLEILNVIEEIANDLFTGCIISEYEPLDTPEKQRWYDKYCELKWTPSKK